MGVGGKVRDPLKACEASVLRSEAEKGSSRGLVSREDLNVGCFDAREIECTGRGSQLHCLWPRQVLSKVEKVLTLALSTSPCEENRLTLGEGSGGVDLGGRDGAGSGNDGSDEDGEVVEHGDGYAGIDGGSCDGEEDGREADGRGGNGIEHSHTCRSYKGQTEAEQTSSQRFDPKRAHQCFVRREFERALTDKLSKAGRQAGRQASGTSCMFLFK